MPILPGSTQATTPAPPQQTTAQTICTNALYEINAVAPGENPDASELAFVLDKFNQLADSWSAQKVYIYANDLVSAAPGGGPAFLLTPGLSPHTIGPSWAGAPTFPVTFERPVRIENVNVLLNNVNPVVRFPLTKRDKDWWATQRLQTIQTALPTDYYYRPDQPLGSLFFWPVPNYAYGVEIEVETVIQGAVALNTVFSAPPGYELAMTLTLAELIAVAFEKPIASMPTLPAAARVARNAIQGLNSSPPRINLDDFGGPSTGRPQATWNYRTGLSR